MSIFGWINKSLYFKISGQKLAGQTPGRYLGGLVVN